MSDISRTSGSFVIWDASGLIGLTIREFPVELIGGESPSPAVSKMAPPMVEAGDKMLMVSWTEPASEKSITHYQVDYKNRKCGRVDGQADRRHRVELHHRRLVNDTAYLVPRSRRR